MNEREAMEIETTGPEETRSLGGKLARILEGGDVVALYGELGSGKTVFVKGVCEALGVEDMVTSPSFTLIQEYSGRIKVVHFDFYRLESVEEVERLDVGYYFDSGAVSMIEWAERGESLLPEERISVIFDRVEEAGSISQNKRTLRFSAPRGRSIGSMAE